jgi:hypothetical protein
MQLLPPAHALVACHLSLLMLDFQSSLKSWY